MVSLDGMTRFGGPRWNRATRRQGVEGLKIKDKDGQANAGESRNASIAIEFRERCLHVVRLDALQRWRLMEIRESTRVDVPLCTRYY